MIGLAEWAAAGVKGLRDFRPWPRGRESGECRAPQPPGRVVVSEADVLDALRPIVDPDFRRSIVDLGFVKNLAIEGGRVSFEIELTTPACPVKAEFERAAHDRVLALEGVTDVAVRMTANTRGRKAASATPSAEVLPDVKNVIAVASGKGGVGKSTTAVNVALALQQAGAQVGLLDADVYGPSLSILTGVSGRPRASAERRMLPQEGYGLKLMSMAFLLTDDSPVIWRGPMVHGLVRQFLTDVEWGELDYLVMDMPPGTGDAALTLAQQAPLSGAVIVTAANELSLIDARIVEGGDAGRPILVDAPESEAARAFSDAAEKVVRKLAVLAAGAPGIADVDITWASS